MVSIAYFLESYRRKRPEDFSILVAYRERQQPTYSWKSDITKEEKKPEFSDSQSALSYNSMRRKELLKKRRES